MKQYIQELEKRNNREKGEWIKEFLSARQIPFSIQKFSTIFARGENIIVDYPFNSRSDAKKTMLSAHYNAWFGTPGANDNASGVSVLLRFVERLLKESKNQPIRIIFFDLEDGWATRGGSRAYAREYGVHDVHEMYNLEMVGMGSHLLLWPGQKDETARTWLTPLVEHARSLGLGVVHAPQARIEIVNFLTPFGFVSDHVTLIESGCERAVALTTIPAEDMRYTPQILDGKRKLRFAFSILAYRLFGLGTAPKLLRHYHNKNDRSEFVEQKNLDTILELLWRVVR
ncbi:MAG: M28 family peptidase [Patescibacteria group bacterium]